MPSCSLRNLCLVFRAVEDPIANCRSVEKIVRSRGFAINKVRIYIVAYRIQQRFVAFVAGGSRGEIAVLKGFLRQQLMAMSAPGITPSTCSTLISSTRCYFNRNCIDN
jgi:hypothetical protein